MKTAYFILGMHRSGTSALGGVLNLMGLEFGSDLMEANEGNPKGYFENNFVYKVNEKILRENDSSWNDYHFNIKDIPQNKIDIYVKEAKEVLKDEFQYVSNFAIKDPRICLLFPIWEQACLEMDINIKIILPYRSPLEVIASLKVRNQFSSELTLLLWIKHFLYAEKYSRKYNRIFLSFDDLIDNTSSVLKEITLFTNLEVSIKKDKNIQAFLDKKIKHNNIPIEQFSKETFTLLEEMLHLIQYKKFEDTVKFDFLRKEFNYQLNFFQHKEIHALIKGLKETNNKLVVKFENLEKEKRNLIEKFHRVESLAIDRKTKIIELEKENNKFEIKFKELKGLSINKDEKITKLKSDNTELTNKFKRVEKLAINRQEETIKLQRENKETSLKFKKVEFLAINRKEEILKLQQDYKNIEALSLLKEEKIVKLKKDNQNLGNKFREVQALAIERKERIIDLLKNKKQLEIEYKKLEFLLSKEKEESSLRKKNIDFSENRLKSIKTLLIKQKDTMFELNNMKEELIKNVKILDKTLLDKSQEILKLHKNNHYIENIRNKMILQIDNLKLENKILKKDKIVQDKEIDKLIQDILYIKENIDI